MGDWVVGRDFEYGQSDCNHVLVFLSWSEAHRHVFGGLAVCGAELFLFSLGVHVIDRALPFLRPPSRLERTERHGSDAKVPSVSGKQHLIWMLAFELIPMIRVTAAYSPEVQ